MWGDSPSKGYGLVKFETSTHSQLTAQTTVRVNFNCQVRADRMGPNPSYKKDTPLDTSKFGRNTGKSHQQPKMSMHYTPLGARTVASPTEPRKALTPQQAAYYERLAAFHKNSDHSAIRTSANGKGVLASKGSEQDLGR